MMNKISALAGFVLIGMVILYVVKQNTADDESFYYGKVVSLDADSSLLTFVSEKSGDEEQLLVEPHSHVLLKEGERVRGMLSESSEGRRLERIWPARVEDEARLAEVQHYLKTETDLRRMNPEKGVGEEVPEFVLYDQKGRFVSSKEWAGSYVVIAFVFSRCPLPDMCPATIMRMKDLAEDLKASPVKDWKLVAITMDPEWDTPGVLNTYATNVDAQSLTFLTGPWQTMKYLFRQFGLAVQPDEKVMLKHTMMTALLGPDGKFLMKDNTSLWSLDEFYKKILEDYSSSPSL